MTMVQWTPALVEQFTADVKAALTKYPAEARRIHKAALLVLDGKVELHSDGSATIQSSTGSNTYHVNGHCACIAGEQFHVERCAHKYAKTFMRRLGHAPGFDADAHIRQTQGGHESMAAHVCDGAWRSARESAGHAVTAGK